MSTTELTRLVSESLAELRREETLAWVLTMCVCALGFVGAAVMVLL